MSEILTPKELHDHPLCTTDYAHADSVRATIDALAAALRAVDGILMDEIAGWQDGGGPSLDELKQRRLAAIEPVKVWL